MTTSFISNIMESIEQQYQEALARGFKGNRSEFELTIDNVNDMEDSLEISFSNYWRTLKLAYREWSETYDEE